MSTYVESWLWGHTTGTAALRLTDSGGTDTISITASMSAVDVLAAWQTAANASAILNGTYLFDQGTSGVSLTCSEVFSVDFSASTVQGMAEWLGFAGSLSGSTYYDSTLAPHAVVYCPVGYTPPEEVSVVRMAEYRLGRSAAWSYSYGRRVKWTMVVPAATYAVIRGGPLLAGKVRVHHSTGASAYSASDLTGYLDVRSARVVGVELLGQTEAYVRITMEGILDEGETETLPTSGGFAEYAHAWQYGWGIMYALQIEGIAHVFVERDVGAADPTGYTQVAGLVIDDSARVGSIVDREDGVGRSYDLTFGLLDSGRSASGPMKQSEADAAVVRGLFTAPTNWARITADVADTEIAIIDVADTTGWPSSGTLHLGRESIAYAGTTAVRFSTLTRGGPNSEWTAYDHRVASVMGTILTDSPQIWRGREVRMYAVLLDMFGDPRGANILSESAMIWRGHISSPPRRGGADGVWQVDCRALDARLADPVGATISGKGVWRFDSDPLVQVTHNMVWHISLKVATTGSNETTEFTIEPFAAEASGYIRASKARALVITALSAVTPTWSPGTLAPTINRWWWDSYTPLDASPDQRVHILRYEFTAAETVSYDMTVRGTITQTPEIIPAFAVAATQIQGYTASTTVRSQLWLAAYAHSSLRAGSLRITVDEGDIADLPSTGWVAIDSDGGEMVVEYDSITSGAAAEPAGSNQVDIGLAPSQVLDTGKITEALLGGEDVEASVRFAFRDVGTLEDVLRRMIMSSGRGDNGTGTYDTLPLRQGYDIATVDEDSFNDLWGLESSALGALTLVVDADTSLVSLFGGWLALSQRAVAMRWDGSDLVLSAVRTGMADTGLYSAAITDADLTWSAGSAGSAVRVLTAIPRPNVVRAAIKKTSSTKTSEIIINDLQRMRAEGAIKWDVDLHGATRSQAATMVAGWAQGLFAQSLGRAQIVELDVHPSLPIEVGDAVKLNLTHPALWSYASGTSGYAGFGRVLGVQLKLASGARTITVIIDGAISTRALSPSPQVVTWLGSAAAPTEIRVALDHCDLFAQWHNDYGDFDVVAYLPGVDTAGYRYTITGVSQGATYTGLTVGAQTGTFTITAAWRITAPAGGGAGSTAATDRHAHTNSSGAWL